MTNSHWFKGCHAALPFGLLLPLLHLCACDADGEGKGERDAAADARADAAVSETLPIENWEADRIFAFLWEGARPSGSFEIIKGTPLASPRAESNRALHFSDLSSSEGFEVRGHAHMAFPSDSTIKIWARTGLANSERLIVAVTGSESESFTQVRDQGRTWMGIEVVITPSWRQIEIPLSSLQPLGAGVPAPLRSNNLVMLHFVTLAETFDFWIDDIELHCPRGC